MKRTGHYLYLSIVVENALVLSCAFICTLTLSTPSWPPFIYLFLVAPATVACLQSPSLRSFLRWIMSTKQSLHRHHTPSDLQAQLSVSPLLRLPSKNLLKTGLTERFR